MRFLFLKLGLDHHLGRSRTRGKRRNGSRVNLILLANAWLFTIPSQSGRCRKKEKKGGKRRVRWIVKVPSAQAKQNRWASTPSTRSVGTATTDQTTTTTTKIKAATASASAHLLAHRRNPRMTSHRNHCRHPGHQPQHPGGAFSVRLRPVAGPRLTRLCLLSSAFGMRAVSQPAPRAAAPFAANLQCPSSEIAELALATVAPFAAACTVA